MWCHACLWIYINSARMQSHMELHLSLNTYCYFVCYIQTQRHSQAGKIKNWLSKTFTSFKFCLAKNTLYLPNFILIFLVCKPIICMDLNLRRGRKDRKPKEWFDKRHWMTINWPFLYSSLSHMFSHLFLKQFN